MGKASRRTKAVYRVDAENNLIYSQKTVINGEWILDEGDTLSYNVTAEQKDHYGEKISFTAKYKDTENHTLTVYIDEKSSPLKMDSATLRIDGLWELNEFNKLQFKIKRAGENYDTLAFQGKWTIDTHHAITYTQNERHLKSGRALDTEFKIKGYWKSFENGRLYYELLGDNRRPLSVSAGLAALEKGRVIAKIMATGDNDTIEFKGKWVISPILGLGFEVDYGNNTVHNLVLTLDVIISDSNRLTLKANDHLSVELVQKLLDSDAELVTKYTQKGASFELYFGAALKF